MKIHPTAIVEDGAQLGADVEVGAYAIIGRQAVVGAGTRVLSHAVLDGRVTLGERNLVGHGAVIGAPPQDFAFDPATESGVSIGNGNTFREHVTIHRGTGAGTVTTVGDDNFVMVGVHFGHNVHVGSRTVIANNCLLAGHVEIQDQVVLGGGTVFHQFMRIGRLAMVRGGTRFGQDIPPFCMGDEDNLLAGLNAVGLRRAGFSAEARMEIKRAFRFMFRAGRNVSQALEEAAAGAWGAEAREFFDFIRAAKRRGVCRAHHRGGDGED